MMKPLIGITCNYTADFTIGVQTAFGLRGQDWQMIANQYIQSVERAGGIPVIVPICDETGTARETVDKLDGLLLSGGCDMDPNLYGEAIQRETGALYPNRDAIEIAIMQHAYENTGIPILGICRGIQLMNVALGGTLYQDLEKEAYNRHFMDAPMNHYVHTVALAEGSHLRRIIGEETLQVNSFHHQAVKGLGGGFVATAVSPDGVVEAIEMPGSRLVMGLQWHPEMLFDCDTNQSIFRAMVAACAAK